MMQAWHNTILRRERLEKRGKCLHERRRFNRVLRGGDDNIIILRLVCHRDDIFSLIVKHYDGGVPVWTTGYHLLPLQSLIERWSSLSLQDINRLFYTHKDVRAGLNGLVVFLQTLRTVNDIQIREERYDGLASYLTNLLAMWSRPAQLTLPTALFTEVGRLDTEVLNIQGTSVSLLPESLRTATNVEYLHLEDNPNMKPSPGNCEQIIQLVKRTNQEELWVMYDSATPWFPSISSHLERYHADVVVTGYGETYTTLKRIVFARMEDAPTFETGNGLAWEVHNEFKKTYDDFHENVEKMKAFVGDWDVDHWIGAAVGPGGAKQHVERSHTARFAVLRAYLEQMIAISFTTDDENNAMSEEAVEIIRANKRQQLSHIFDRVSGQEISGQLYVFSLLAIKFILKINNPLLTEEYIARFVDECVNAYGRTGMTCVRGIRERLILVFDTAFKSFCCQQGLCVNENIDQGTIDTLCPVDLIKPLLDAVANDRTFNAYSAQWSYDAANQDLELKDRRGAFIDAMTEQYTEGIEHEEAQEAQEAVRAAIDAKVRGLEDAERANFGCADVDDIFSDPVDCAKPKEARRLGDAVERRVQT